MQIIVNNFTKFKFEKLEDKLLSKKYLIEFENEYIKYRNDNINLENIELKNATLDIERLIKHKLGDAPKRIKFKDEQISLILYPMVYGNRSIIDLQVFLKNTDNKYVSDYTLTLEKEDFIVLYNYLCEVLEIQNKLMLPDEYEYMFLFVRYLDIDSVKQFCYISDDPNIRIGDYVLVDRAGQESYAIVEQIEYHTKDEAPYNFDKTKEIIRRVDKKELKDNEENEDNDNEETFITRTEYNELKKDYIILQDIIKNMNIPISIKEFMKVITRDNSYAMLYFNKKINTFIEKAGDINYLIKYGRVVFNVKDLAQYVKDSIYINPSIDNNINNVYEIAKKTCEENAITYNDDFIAYYNDVPSELCEVTKVIEKEEEVHSNLYLSILSKCYSNLKFYVRDSDLSKNQISQYQNNIGKFIKEKAFVDCTKKIGMLQKNTRYIIFSNNIKDISIHEDKTDFGICIANKDSIFKIVDVISANDKNYIILLHVNKDDKLMINELKTNVEDNLIEFTKNTINEKTEIIPELTDEWYNRLFFPIGIDPDNNINLV